MKKYIPLLFLCLAFALLKGQVYNYIPLPDSNMTWNGDTEHGGLGQVAYTQWQYYLSGDTIVSNQPYHMITKRGSGLTGLIREDSSKKVYYIPIGNYGVQTGFTIYDFSLNKGDTLFTYGTYFAVVGVDTPIYYHVPRRTLHISTPGAPYVSYDWIEGLGSRIFPGGTIPLKMLSYPAQELCDIEINGAVFFSQSGALGGCHLFYPLDVNDIEGQLHVSCYPNPTGDILTVNADNVAAYDFEIYNTVGQIQMKQHNLENGAYTFSVKELVSGIYFLKAKDINGNTGTIRFVKTD